jgi:Tfp pilus assembly protein PilF
LEKKFDFTEEIGLLRRAVAEPVPQLIVVEFDTLARLDAALEELVALNPARAHVILKFDFERDTANGLFHQAREKLKAAAGVPPPLLVLEGPAKIEQAEGAPVSERFWKEMNQAREAWDSLGAQILLCLEGWSYRQANLHASHLLSWAGMRIHLAAATERPVVTDRTALSAGLFGDYRVTPELARERWQELEQGLNQARERGEPGIGFLQRFYIPMLEAALSAGDLVLARQTRDAANGHGQFPDENMPRWHELNLGLALAGHETDLANEHAYQLLNLAENHPNERVRERALVAVNNQAQLLAKTTEFRLAETLFRKALEFAEKNYGLENPKIAALLSNFAQLLKATNRLEEAELLVRRVLAIDEKNYGPEHPDVAISLNNLGQLLKATNRPSEAEPLIRRALAIDEKNYGPEHPEVAISLNNLATLLQATNRLAEAEPLMRRALAIGEKRYGPEHPTVAIRLNNLSQILQATNRLAEAEPLIRRALAIIEKCYGAEHPTFASNLNNLASLLFATNRLAEAELLMRRALAIDEKCYGPEHPDVAIDLSNLALLLKATHRLAEAEILMRRGWKIDEKSRGPEHPDVAIDLNNLATLLQETNRQSEAEPLIRRALAIDEKSYEPDHPSIARDLNNLARLLQDTNRLVEADPLMRRHLIIFLKFTRNTGYLHPNLQAGFNNYGILLERLSLTPAQISQRFTELGKEAGFDEKSFQQLMSQLFPKQ